MVPRKLRRKLSSSKSGIFESEVKAAFIRASSEAEEFKTLFNFNASDLLGLLEIERVGDSDVFGSILLCVERYTRALYEIFRFWQETRK